MIRRFLCRHGIHRWDFLRARETIFGAHPDRPSRYGLWQSEWRCRWCGRWTVG